MTKPGPIWLDKPNAIGWWNCVCEEVQETTTNGTTTIKTTTTTILVYVWSVKPLAIKRDGEHPRPGARVYGWRRPSPSHTAYAEKNL